MAKVAETQKLNSRQGMPEDTAIDSKTIDNTNPITWIKQFPYSITSYKKFSNFFKELIHLERKFFSIYTQLFAYLRDLDSEGKGKYSISNSEKSWFFLVILLSLLIFRKWSHTKTVMFALYRGCN